MTRAGIRSPRPAAPSRASVARGFTLLELLVAISVLAIVSMIAWRGLESLVATRERLQPEGEEVRAMLTAFGQLERDLAQVAMPEFFALSAPPVSVRSSPHGPVLEIVRIAASGEDVATRLQTVFYRLDEGALLRQATPPAQALAVQDAESMHNVRLLGQVGAIHVRVWRDGQGWIDPIAAAAAGVAPLPPPQGIPPLRAAIPPGIEFVIERADGKRYRRVLLVG
jgi:general secretion pathway protein J